MPGCAPAYLADIARGEEITRPLMQRRHRQLQWFRAPNLETGHPAPVRAQISDWLGAHGYKVAPVTLNASDWQFAEPYDDAVAHHDTARAAAIRASYLAYTRQMIGWYQQSSQALFGRDIAHVMLLHATRLNADCIDDLAAMLRAARLRPVSLARALRDPAYRTPDLAPQEDGTDWIDRWAITLKKPLPWDTYREVPSEITAEYDRLDHDREPH